MHFANARDNSNKPPSKAFSRSRYPLPNSVIKDFMLNESNNALMHSDESSIVYNGERSSETTQSNVAFKICLKITLGPASFVE